MKVYYIQPASIVSCLKVWVSSEGEIADVATCELGSNKTTSCNLLPLLSSDVVSELYSRIDAINQNLVY
jgi:hypothetical protein